MRVVGERFAGKYRLEGLLGEGGMGTVWRAHHLELDCPVAVKFQHGHRGGGERATARSRREARAAAKLTNPHVVRILDFDVEAGTPYLVMELLEGESLRARLERMTSAPLGEAVELVCQVASALDAVHAAGIVHRDLKPSNLFIIRSGERELLKLLDFGVAKWFESSGDGGPTTESGLVVGSVGYMSPEQARGDAVDQRADVWSLGVVAYQLTTGRLPFEGMNVPDTIARVCLGRFESLESLRGNAVAPLDAVFARAFALERAERFASAGELARAFEAASRLVPKATRLTGSVPAAGGWVFGRDSATQDMPRSRRGRRATMVAGSLAATVAALTAIALPLLQAREVAPPREQPVELLADTAAARRRAPESVPAVVSASLVVPAAVTGAALAPPSAAPSATEQRPPRRTVKTQLRVVPSASAAGSGAAATEVSRPALHPVFGIELPEPR